MAVDRYPNFSALAASEREGLDFERIVEARRSGVAVIAPHGGSIEPTTSEIAGAIAGTAHSLYAFVAHEPGLHLTSTNFDDPDCIALISSCDRVLAVHGLAEGTERILAGGLDVVLRGRLQEDLARAGFDAIVIEDGHYSGTSPRNICNRGRSAKGVQLEIARGLRDCLRDDVALMRRFADATRAALERG